MLNTAAKDGCRYLILRIKLVETASGYPPAVHKKAQGTTRKIKRVSGTTGRKKMTAHPTQDLISARAPRVPRTTLPPPT
jgi:hypothetical protein